MFFSAAILALASPLAASAARLSLPIRAIDGSAIALSPNAIVPAPASAATSVVYPPAGTADVLKLAANFFTAINITVDVYPLAIVVSGSFVASNPTPCPIAVKAVDIDLGRKGVAYFGIQQAFRKFVIPPRSSANSGLINNITLPLGLISAVQNHIFDQPFLDVTGQLTLKIDLYSPIEVYNYAQKNIPTRFIREAKP